MGPKSDHSDNSRSDLGGTARLLDTVNPEAQVQLDSVKTAPRRVVAEQGQVVPEHRGSRGK